MNDESKKLSQFDIVCFNMDSSSSNEETPVLVYSMKMNDSPVTEKSMPIDITESNATAARPENDHIEYGYDENLKSGDLKNYEIYRLELILGPMWSGKTSELIRRLRNKSIYKKILAVNTRKDNRYGSDGVITHDGLAMTTRCLRVDSLYELRTMKDYIESEVVGIDEGNFFPEIEKFVVEELELTSKTFIVAGLNGDKDRQFFGKIHELIPHAERIDFLTALCKQCADGTEASFSIELEKFEGQEKVGGTGIYEAVCRKHYSQMRYSQYIDKVNILKRSNPSLSIRISPDPDTIRK